MTEGRKGKRTKDQLRQEMMRRAKTAAENKYGIGGREKAGRHLPSNDWMAKLKEKIGFGD